MRLVEPLEDQVTFLDGDAGSVVADGDVQRIIGGTRYNHLDRATVWTVLKGVVEQIGDDLLNSQWVDVGFHRRWRSQGNGVAAAARLCADNDVFDDGHDIGCLGLQLKLAD